MEKTNVFSMSDLQEFEELEILGGGTNGTVVQEGCTNSVAGCASCDVQSGCSNDAAGCAGCDVEEEDKGAGGEKP